MPDISVEVNALNIEVEVNALNIEVELGQTGPQGVPGGAATETYPAGENLSTGRVVILEAGEAFYFQPTDPDHAGRVVGLTKSSASTGSDVSIQPFGVASDPAFSFTPDVGLYATTNGQITATKPTTDIIQFVGVALETNKIRLDFWPSIQ